MGDESPSCVGDDHPNLGPSFINGSTCAFDIRDWYCRELWATNGAELTRSLSGGRVPEVGDGDE